MTPEEIREKQKLLGERVLIYGKMSRLQVVILNHYDPQSDTYDGASLFPGKVRVKVEAGSNFQAGSVLDLIATLPVTGLRRYPYAARPDYARQFVYPGEDTEPLRLIAEGNAAATAPQSQPASSTTSADEPTPAEIADEKPTASLADEEQFDPADTDQDGEVSEKEQKKFNKRQKREENQ